MEQQTIYITNSLTRKKEKFEPMHAGFVGMYVCGPTVYGHTHLGHARPYITFDVVARYFRHVEYRVRYVKNITDVGHLTDEVEGTGEDRISKKARLEQLEPMEVAQRYTEEYHNQLRALNIEPPSIEPRASGHIIEQIEMIKRIVENGFAYEVNGSVYFDVVKYNSSNHYGKLSGRVIDELMAGAGEERRALEGQEEKRNRVDFALWKKAQPEHIMRWQSPWGVGFPGWHIECSAIALRYLDTDLNNREFSLDIQGGGSDLIFPHHEMSAAQSKILSGKPFARHYVHAGMIGLDGTKMSKSLGNLLFVSKLINEGVPPMAIRWALLNRHYRADFMWSKSHLDSAIEDIQRLQLNLSRVEVAPTDGVITTIIQSLADDLNSPQAIASVRNWCEETEKGARGGNAGELSRAIDALLGIAL